MASETQQVGDHRYYQRGVSRGELFIPARGAIDIVKERREEFQAIAKDAGVHLQSDDSRAQQEAVQHLWNKVSEAFGLEKVRVFVEVMEDDLLIPWSCERRRLEEAQGFLGKQVWLDVDLDDPCRGGVCWSEGSVLEDPTPDSTWQVSVRANEMGTFQVALMAKYLHRLMSEAFDDGDGGVDDDVFDRWPLHLVWLDQASQFNAS